MIAYIGMGSNLKQPIRQIKTAIESLCELSDDITCSSLYRNPPLDNQKQENYINAVIKLETNLSAPALLSALQAIENQQGRERSDDRWGPRTLDLDILLYNNENINTETLTVPHYDLAQRIFFIMPLHEIAPNLVLPNGDVINDLLNQFSESVKSSMQKIS
tara:strand:- start:58618 stop:59100 length:483 start_codon:yes stop_codon:yes gene_type:complete